LLAPGTPVVVGASGGLDSTALLDLLCRADLRPVAAHVNYGLRGADSNGDERFVRSLCADAEVPCFVHRARPDGDNVQARARAIRYRFFGDVAKDVGASVVMTAHHRDDQAETLLLHLFRGTGPVGLAGIPASRPLTPGSDVTVVRPLLHVGRSEIEAYARARALRWREDASNREADYRRNVVRHEILPLVEQRFGGATNSIARTASLLRDYLDAGAALAPDAALDAIAEPVEGGCRLCLDGLRAQPETIRRGLLLEALRRWLPAAPRSAATVRELAALLDAQPGRKIEWPGGTVWREREHIAFVPTADAEREVDVEITLGETWTPFGTLLADPLGAVPTAFDPSPLVEVVDGDALRWPLRLRTWRSGDALRPLGLDGQKKVSDLLTERRVPSHRRARQLVLLSEGEVVWVVGHRLSALVAVGPETQHPVRLAWNPHEALAPDDEGR
jgi:tRNA(Ile)-lysidine synthase